MVPKDKLELPTKTGFTLTEVMITVVILAVVAGLALPGYRGVVEESRSNEARTVLSIIHMGQKIYRLNNATYWNGDPGGGNNKTPAQLLAALNVDVSPEFYTDIDITSATANGYVCRVTRNPGTRFYEYDYDATRNPQLNINVGGSF